ncbi:hypothetical protein [Kribbella sp. NPDC004875]|uniref:hypothetical protein n=1 Tax=Kribbella sp. NPDC004875 TaxID=3364107 RepID=UPI00368F6202
MDQQVEELSATFSTSRVRAIIWAPIATFLVVGFSPRDLKYEHPVWDVFFNLVCLLFLVLAVRAWIAVLRPRFELRLASDALTIKRGRRKLIAPWQSVGRVRVEWHSKVPWVVVWLDATVTPDDVPVRRREDGSYWVLPVGLGRSTRKRTKQLEQFRTAVMGCGGRYLDPF